MTNGDRDRMTKLGLDRLVGLGYRCVWSRRARAWAIPWSQFFDFYSSPEPPSSRQTRRLFIGQSFNKELHFLPSLQTIRLTFGVQPHHVLLSQQATIKSVKISFILRTQLQYACKNCTQCVCVEICTYNGGGSVCINLRPSCTSTNRAALRTFRSQACRLCATVECNKHPAWHRFLRRRRRSWVNSELTPDSRPPPSSPPLAPTDRPYNGKSTSAHFRCVGPRHPVQSVSR